MPGAKSKRRSSSKPSRKKTLSFLFHQTSHTVHKAVNKKTRLFGQYYTQVFLPEDTDPAGTMPCIGSWPHESQAEFVEFLDMFYEVCFKRLVEIETPDVPLLLKFALTIQQAHLLAPAEHVTTNVTVAVPRDVEGPKPRRVASYQPVANKRVVEGRVV